MQPSLEAAELIDERPDERLDTARLEPYLRAHLEGAEGPLSVRQFGGGKANLTYLMRFGEQANSCCAGRPWGRSRRARTICGASTACCRCCTGAFRWRRAACLLCEDESIIGAVFIVEERRHGFVIRDDIPPEFAGRPELNRRIGVCAGRCARRSAPGAAGGDRARRSRPARGLSRTPAFGLDAALAGGARAASERKQSAAEMAPVLDWLGARICRNRAPRRCCTTTTGSTIACSIRPIPAHIVAVLDWDMCTQGDPLADLGYVLNYWVEPGDPPEWREIASMPTWRDGFPSRAEAIARYAARTGFDVGAIGWHQVFAAFKLAVIIQQIYIRFVRGQTQDQRFRHYYRRVIGLAAKARLLAGLSSHA